MSAGSVTKLAGVARDKSSVVVREEREARVEDGLVATVASGGCRQRL